MTIANERYQTLREVFRGERFPLAFVDLDAFDTNVAHVSEKARTAGKTIRLGTKSIRCEPLMQRIVDHSTVYRGFLTYTVEETAFLADKGHDDFLIAYPAVQDSDIGLLVRLVRDGKSVSVMVDSLEHLTVLSAAGEQAGVTMPACLEIDLAYRPLGTDRVHLGLWRSPIRTPGQALDLVQQAKSLPGVRIDSLMGYEGHIAGVSDDTPRQAVKNLLLRALKNASVRELTSRRQAVVRSLREAGVELRLVNGGGSGSLVSTLRDESVTEVTVGSGFFAPGLFHHFKEVKYQPSAFFAIQVVRIPKPGFVTCQGGGYIASGPADAGKVPLPVMPAGLQLLPLEGAGEVQTPLKVPANGPALTLGDPVIFQHAKAGELCEHFNPLYLVRGDQIVDMVPTYRGDGMSFL